MNSLSKYLDITVLRPRYDRTEKKKIINTSVKEIIVDVPEILHKVLKLKRLPIRPDRYLLYYPSFRNYLSKMDLRNFDFFMTRSQFHSNHLLGLFLKKKLKIPWYAHFSDPWYNNPVQKKIFLLEKFSFFLQKQVIKKSDFNIFPHQRLKFFFASQYLSQKIQKNSFVIPHTIQKIYNPSKKDKNEISVRFFGKIYAGRNIENALIALTNLKKECKVKSADFFVDDDFLSNNKAIKKKFSKINFYRYINPKAYFKMLMNTSILLLIDIDEEYGNLFFQSKLVDYLGSQRPILHIGKSLTYNREIILKCNGSSCLNETKDIYRTLTNMIENISLYKSNKRFINNLASDKIAKDLSRRIIDDLKHV